MFTVAQVAKQAGVSPAAVRARISDGALAGRQVLIGGRKVWEIDEASAAAYVAQHRASADRHAQGAVGTDGGLSGEPVDLLDELHRRGASPHTRPRKAVTNHAHTAPARAHAPEEERVNELEAEVARLKAALSALSRANSALVEAVGT